MTDEQLAVIRARCEAATPGPWRTGWVRRTCRKVHQHGTGRCKYEFDSWVDDDSTISRADDPFYVVVNTTEEYGAMQGCDAAFIAAARSDVPALLAEVAVLRELMADRERDLQFEYDRANLAEAEIERLRGLLSSGAPA